MKTVSIIVPTYRDFDDLLKCRDALLAQTYPREHCEFLFIDNTPEFELEHKAEMLKPARLLHQPTRGPAAARNMGLANANHEYIGFTDADCLPEPDWIEQGVKAMDEYEGMVLVAGGVTVFAADPDRPNAVEVFEFIWGFPQEAYVVDDHFGVTANVFTSRAVVDRAGGFDEGLFSGEDFEFCVRIFKCGIPVVYGGQVLIRHPARRTLVELLGKTTRILKGVYDLEQGGHLPKGAFARELWRDLRPPIRQSWLLMTDERNVHLPARLASPIVAFSHRYHQAFMRLKIMLFGTRTVSRSY